MVKSILDSFCMKSGILCRRCEEKVEKGLVTGLDLKVIGKLVQLEKDNPTLQDITYHRSVETEDTLAMIVDRKDLPKLLASGAKLAKSIGEAFGKRIKVIGFGGDEREFLEDLFSPLSILTINKVWIPDGTTETKVILSGRKPRRMPMDPEMIRQIAQGMKGITLRIEFEQQ